MPKVLIDITDEHYKDLMGQIKKVADEEDFCLSSTEIYNTAYLFLIALESGIVLDGLTNGEVIMEMFPDAKITQESYVVFAHIEECNHPFDKAWWNRKWAPHPIGAIVEYVLDGDTLTGYYNGYYNEKHYVCSMKSNVGKYIDGEIPVGTPVSQESIRPIRG